MKFLPTLLLYATLVWSAPGQARAQTQASADKAEDAEQRDLSTAMGEAGNSPVDFVRVLERHLKKYPNAKNRDVIEHALVRAAVDAKDDRRIVLYGERFLAANPKDVQILEKVASALLARSDGGSPEKLPEKVYDKAYGYAHQLELALTEIRAQEPPEGYSVVRWQNMTDRRLAAALRLEAEAQGRSGKTAEAEALSRRSWETCPTSGGAREWGRWLAANGKAMDAVARYADAFTLEDPDSTEEDRAHDRARMGELYRQVHQSEKGLGDMILQAYDRTFALSAERTAKLRESDPNLQAKAVLDFTLPAMNGEPLKMQSLKGKTVVMDFWATWCGPCRVQRPMYQQVEAMFATNPKVVFLSIDTDQDRTLVAPYVKAQNWTNPVYYEAGLGGMLRVGQIPTTIVLNGEGQIVSRMAGFIPERFVDMLKARIEETLHEQ
jgi:thiol-disulfide isomerase/thioredoxin